MSCLMIPGVHSRGKLINRFNFRTLTLALAMSSCLVLGPMAIVPALATDAGLAQTGAADPKTAQLRLALEKAQSEIERLKIILKDLKEKIAELEKRRARFDEQVKQHADSFVENSVKLTVKNLIDSIEAPLNKLLADKDIKSNQFVKIWKGIRAASEKSKKSLTLNTIPSYFTKGLRQIAWEFTPNGW